MYEAMIHAQTTEAIELLYSQGRAVVLLVSPNAFRER